MYQNSIKNHPFIIYRDIVYYWIIIFDAYYIPLGSLINNNNNNKASFVYKISTCRVTRCSSSGNIRLNTFPLSRDVIWLKPAVRSAPSVLSYLVPSVYFWNERWHLGRLSLPLSLHASTAGLAFYMASGFFLCVFLKRTLTFGTSQSPLLLLLLLAPWENCPSIIVIISCLDRPEPPRTLRIICSPERKMWHFQFHCHRWKIKSEG